MNNFWDIMFKALDDTTDADWENFVDVFDLEHAAQPCNFEVTISKKQELAISHDELVGIIDNDLLVLAA